MYCHWGGNVNIRRMSNNDMGFIFHMKNQSNILVIGNYYVNYHNYQNLMLLTSSDTKRTLMHSCLKIPPRENWFQYVRRVYATAINFPCITTSYTSKYSLYHCKPHSYIFNHKVHSSDTTAYNIHQIKTYF